MSTTEPSARGGTAARRAARTTRPDAAARPSEAVVRRRLDPDALAALEEERDFLLRSLDDLEREHDAGDVDDDDYAELKDDYTARAATVLRAIDDRRALATSARAPRSWGRTAVALCVVAVLATGVGWLVFRGSDSRAPGQGISGDTRQDSANLLLEAQQHTGQATQALQRGDGQGALEAYKKAIETYDKVLEISPRNVEAMTYRGWVINTIATNTDAAAASQLVDEARQWLDRAIATDPGYADARVFRAILERNARDFAAAQADLDAVDTSQIPSYMQNMIDSVRRDVQAGVGGSSSASG